MQPNSGNTTTTTEQMMQIYESNFVQTAEPIINSSSYSVSTAHAVNMAKDLVPYNIFEADASKYDDEYLYNLLEQDLSYRNTNADLIDFYNTYQNTGRHKSLEIFNSINNTEGQEQSAMQSALNALETTNSALTGTELWLQNIKQLNSLYINYLRTNGEDSLFSEQNRIALKAIADDCPYTAGVAVYLARGIFARINPNLHWHNYAQCTQFVGLNKTGENPLQQELNMTRKNVNTPAVNAYVISAYPNPASSEVTLSSVHQIPSGSVITIFNAEGRLLKRIEIPSLASEIKLDVSTLTSGFYTFKLSAQNQTISYGKFTIQ
jgi:Secretion system C-terminal sorting domain